MNNFILINRTFSEVTPESAEHGDFSRTGFISVSEQVSFSELVKLMQEHNEPSNSWKNDTNTWYSCYPYTSDWGKGIERTESIHFSSDNTPNAEKYWSKARSYANKK